MSKFLRSLISIMLALVMCLSLLPTMAFAAESDEWILPSGKATLLCIGDSTSNGYFLDNYVDENCGIGDNAAPSSYPIKLYNDLLSYYNNDKDSVTLAQFCLNSMRPNELRYLLEKSFNKPLSKLDSYGENCIEDIIDSYNNAKANGGKYLGYPDAGDFYASFKKSVTEADFITLDLGGNNFGTYTRQRLLSDLEVEDTYVPGGEYDDILPDIQDELNATFPKNNKNDSTPMTVYLRNKEADILKQIDEEGFDKLAQSVGFLNTDSLFYEMGHMSAADARALQHKVYQAALDQEGTVGFALYDIVESVIYNYASVALNYQKSLDYIYDNEVNPDAMIVVNGLYNPLTGVSADMSDAGTVADSYDFGELFGELIGDINGFLNGTNADYTCKYADKYRFSDMSNISTFVDQVKNFSGDPVTNYKKVDVTLLENIIDLAYTLGDNVDVDVAEQVGTSLLDGIKGVVYDQVLDGIKEDDTARKALYGKDGKTPVEIPNDTKMPDGSIVSKGTPIAEAMATYASQKVVQSIKSTFGLNSTTHTYLTAADVKKAYKTNKKAEITVDTSEMSKSLVDILGGDFSYMDSTFASKDTAYYAVAAGFDIIRTSLVKAAAVNKFNMSSLLDIMGDQDEMMDMVSKALADYDKPYGKDTAKNNAAHALLHICVRFVGLHGFGIHPDPAGAAQKYNAVSANFPIPMALPVENVTVSTDKTSGKPVISWDKTDGAVKYQVWRSTDGKDFGSKPLYTTSKLTYTNTSAKVNTKYYYEIRAVAENGSVGKGTISAAVTCACAVPEITLSNNTSGKPVVTWETVDGASRYDLLRSTDGKTFTSLGADLAKTATSYTDTSAKVGTTYYYKLTAVAKPKSTTSDAQSIVCKCAKPTVSSLTNTSSGITVKWSKVTGATGYYIYRGSSKIATISSGSTVSYTDKKATTNGTKYQYKIYAIVKADDGKTYKSTVSATKTTYRLSTPTISSAKNTSSKKITVKWGKNSKATGYQVKYQIGSNTAKTVKVTSASTVSKVLSSLTKGKTYKISVRAYKTVSGSTYYSAYSSVQSVKVSK